MNDQKKFWDDAIASGSVFKSTNDQTDFAQEIVTMLKPQSKILDLGCGLGADDIVFAKAGHTVVATDFSEVAIKKNKELLMDYPNLSFEILDMNEPFHFKDNEFDAVYARLSLHYFNDTKTREIFKEVHRVLKPDGYFCFLCKSTNDTLYGEGEKIEKNMYERKGHIRHFFSEEYTMSLLEKYFAVDSIVNGDQKIYTRDSSFIKVVAHAVKTSPTA